MSRIGSVFMDTKSYRFIKIISFNECDPAGIVFFANYFVFCHSAYEEMLRERGLWSNIFDNPSLAFPLRATTAEFKYPCKCSEKITIDVFTQRVSDSSFTVCYLVKNESERIIAELTTSHVCVDKNSGVKSQLPEELKSFFLSMLPENLRQKD